MKIAIIGTGNVGTALGTAFARAGHDVTLAARDVDKTRTIAAEIGASAADSPAQAARDAEVVILAVPFGAIGDVAGSIAASSAGKVVVDVTNPLTPDYSGLATEGGPSAAEQLADRLGDARVVKAFNTLFASLQTNPTAHGVALDAFYATDDEAAAATLADLIRSIGFRPINTGALRMARQLEALAWLNMSFQLRTGGDWQSSFVLVGAPAGLVAEPAAAGAARN